MVLNSETIFNTGDTVVYPKHGVGIIQNIVENEFRDEKFLSYAIKIKASAIEVFVPLKGAENLGLRKLKEDHDLDKSLEILSKKEEVEELLGAKSWKERKKILDDLFKSGNPEDLAKIVKYLYFKNKQKDLPNSERKIYDASLKFLLLELSEVKGISEEEADHLVAQLLIQ